MLSARWDLSLTQMQRRVCPLLLGDEYKNTLGAVLCFMLKQVLAINVKIHLFHWHADHEFWLQAVMTWPYKQPSGFLPESLVPFCLSLLPSIHSAFDSGPIGPKFVSSSLDCEVTGEEALCFTRGCVLCVFIVADISWACECVGWMNELLMETAGNLARLCVMESCSWAPNTEVCWIRDNQRRGCVSREEKPSMRWEWGGYVHSETHVWQGIHPYDRATTYI